MVASGWLDGPLGSIFAKNVQICKSELRRPSSEEVLRAFVRTISTLALASPGLVAALAWNEAIKATLAYLGLGVSLAGLYTYAIIATVIAVAVLVWLGKLASRVGGDAAFSREAEG